MKGIGGTQGTYKRSSLTTGVSYTQLLPPRSSAYEHNLSSSMEDIGREGSLLQRRWGYTRVDEEDV